MFRMTSFFAVAVIFQLLISSSVCANDTNRASDRKTYTTFGLRSCSKWLQDEKDAKTASQNGFNELNFIDDQSWLAGFISGFNVAITDRQDLLSEMDLQAASSRVSVYCNKNKNASVPDAVIALFVEIAKSGK
ncbi:hypothetical protein [Dyella flagellata]|uniref:hypothetical protein n=1 Tax=Dyella flagellata TaxID=1867833 RepID=UPI0024E13A0F|nr:hypothetical protein [Dyella flagellata]